MTWKKFIFYATKIKETWNETVEKWQQFQRRENLFVLFDKRAAMKKCKSPYSILGFLLEATPYFFYTPFLPIDNLWRQSEVRHGDYPSIQSSALL